MRTVQGIRKLLSGAMKQKTFLMDHGYVNKSLQKIMAIETITTRLDIIKDKPLSTHYMWLLRLRNQVIDILPPEAGRYKNLRAQILQLLEEAEERVNSDRLRIVKLDYFLNSPGCR